MRSRREEQRRNLHGRRMADRRPDFGQRVDLALLDGSFSHLSWEDQRTQYWTRLLFCLLALMYFNFGGEAQVRPWASLPVVNVLMTLYGLEIIFFMWHATRVPQAPWRQRLTMWIDIAAASFAASADATLSSPGFLVFLMIILGNGMRYGLRAFAEAVVGCLAASIFIVWMRLDDYRAIFSVSAIFFLVFFAIIVIYSYSLTAKIERARAKLAHERNVDALTGMLNRRALLERASRLFQSSARHGDEIVVLFADLDGFKGVNDRHGHHVGDKVLAAVAERILENVRDADLVARYGGDEFLLVLPRTSSEGGEIVARRVRDGIADWARENGIDFNVSIGIGNFPAHGKDLESVIASVDQAMYRCKTTLGGGGILHAECAGA